MRKSKVKVEVEVEVNPEAEAVVLQVVENIVKRDLEKQGYKVVKILTERN